MSVDAVAARAGVSKPTVYLRHRTKAELATAAIASMRVQPRPAPTDDVRADLVAHLRLLRSGLERPHGMAMLGTMLAEEHDTPELLALFRERLVAPRRRELRAVLEAARARGELRGGASVDVAVNALVGGLLARYLAGEALGGRFVATLVDTVLDGLLSAERIAARTRAMKTACKGRRANSERARRAPGSARGAGPSTRWRGRPRRASRSATSRRAGAPRGP